MYCDSLDVVSYKLRLAIMAASQRRTIPSLFEILTSGLVTSLLFSLMLIVLVPEKGEVTNELEEFLVDIYYTIGIDCNEGVLFLTSR